MKVAVSSLGQTLDDQIDFRFGRCTQYLIVDTTDMSFNVLTNSAQNEGHGAGISASQAVINAGVNAVITGQVGPNAYRTLAAAKVTIFTAKGSIRSALVNLVENRLIAQTGPSNSGHMAGLGQGQGMGQGMGQGRRKG
ncbi:MAG: NifB/NifX family molybdenum-iron cluster-binding protein [Candidatus Heimdallarchaeota archaeon]